VSVVVEGGGPASVLVDRADGDVAVISDTGSVANTTTTELLGLPATVSRIVLVRGSHAPGRSRWISR
jgi:hypothetical protein